MNRSTCSSLVSLALLGMACTGSISGPPGPGGTDPAPPSSPGGVEQDTTQPGAASGLPTLRRLTATQYANALKDVLGEPIPTLVLDSEPAAYGFTSVGASSVVTSTLGVERYETAALAVAAQVFSDPAHRVGLTGCTPVGVEDTACTSSFLGSLGRKLYRRQLTTVESERLLALAQGVGRATGDVWSGLEAALAALLTSPKFLYRAELGEVGSDGVRRYTGADLASRLAFFLWSSGPDAQLLDAAESGALGSTAGLQAEVTRLLLSPNARRGFRTFYQELLRLDANPTTGSSLAASLAGAIHEQALRTFEDSLFDRGETFAQLVRTPFTFLNDELAQHYGLPPPGSAGLTPSSLPEGQPRLGVLGLAAVLIKQSNQPNTSPTARGKFVREALLCQSIPAPPPGVATELPESEPGAALSMRERLEVHRTDPQCAACHALTDPIGLGLEHFDALGRYRTEEAGRLIDAAGDLDGTAFSNARELSIAVAQHPDLGACFVTQLARYMTGLGNPGPAASELALSYATSPTSFEQLIQGMVVSNLFAQVQPSVEGE